MALMQCTILGALSAAKEPIPSLEIAIEEVKGRGLDSPTTQGPYHS